MALVGVEDVCGDAERFQGARPVMTRGDAAAAMAGAAYVFSGETTMPALDFDRKLKQQLALGRSLRLSPQSRAAQDTNISMPFGNAMMENTEGGSPEAPWVSK